MLGVKPRSWDRFPTQTYFWCVYGQKSTPIKNLNKMLMGCVKGYIGFVQGKEKSNSKPYQSTFRTYSSSRHAIRWSSAWSSYSIVHDQYELDGSALVHEKTRGTVGLPVAMVGQMGNQALMSQSSGLTEAIYFL